MNWLCNFRTGSRHSAVCAARPGGRYRQPDNIWKHLHGKFRYPRQYRDIQCCPNRLGFFETGTNANALYTAGTGSSNAGDTYSFGATSNAERAFGGLRSAAH